MWCKQCNIETNADICPVCGETTEEDLPVEVYWCDSCQIPVINTIVQADKGSCPICGGKTKYLSADLRPVFPEERLLVELLLNKEPNSLVNESVWASNNRYYINGKSIALSNSIYECANINSIIEKLHSFSVANSYEGFNKYIQLFSLANHSRLEYLKDEAFQFIKKAASKFPAENIVISFSGGKDSTVSADLAVKALSDPSIVHIYGDTTLEFPSTTEYAERFRENHPNAIFQIAKNDEQDFYDVCEDIGPPARMMRWCCSMFKTGPITRVINSLYDSQQILTFYGIRKAESVSRSKYNRIEDSADAVKIKQQTVASPIFFWKDIDIWLYILSENIDFNDAYRLGYTLHTAYAYNASYGTALNFFDEVIFTKEVVDISTLDRRITNLQMFAAALDKKKKSLEYIETAPKILMSLKKVEEIYQLTLAEIEEIQSILSTNYHAPFFNGRSVWNEVSNLPIIQKLQGNDWLLTCIMRQQERVFSLSVAGGIILSLDNSLLSLSQICEWLSSLYGPMSINALEKRFNSTFGTKVSASKLAEKLKTSGAWNDVVTDSMDEYIDSLVDSDLSGIDADNLFQEEFF